MAGTRMSKTLVVAVLSMLVGHACGLRMILSGASNATGEDPAMLFEKDQTIKNCLDSAWLFLSHTEPYSLSFKLLDDW